MQDQSRQALEQEALRRLLEESERRREELERRLEAERNANQAQWRELQNARRERIAQSRTPTLVLDTEERVLFANTPVERMLNASPGALLGKTLGQIVAGERELFNPLSRERAINHAELRFIETAWDGRPAKIIELDDAKERADVKLFQRERENHYRHFIESSLNGVCLVDDSGKICFANKSLWRILRLSPQTKDKRELFPLIHESSREQARSDLEQCSKGVAVENEWRLFQREGEEVRVQVFLSPWTDEKGSSQGTIILLVDLSDRIAVEELSRTHQAYRKALLDSIPDMAWLKDVEGRFVAVNNSFVTAMGVSAAELEGRTDFQLFQPEIAQSMFDKDMTVIGSGQPMTSEDLVVDATDRSFWVETIRTPIFDNQGGVMALANIARDVTQRKSALDELRMTSQELEARVQERTKELERAITILRRVVDEQQRTSAQLERAKRHAESATRAKSIFLANMSHEIRSPLNAIIGLTDLALGAEVEPLVRRYLELVKNAGASLLTVINDILDFSKIEARELVLEDIPFDLRQLLEAACNLHAFQARNKNLDFSLDIDSDVPTMLQGDPVRLRQVIDNLVVNAIKFTPAGSVKVKVHTASTPEPADPVDPTQPSRITLLFTVKDTGVGIATEQQQAIFESFHQADGSITRQYGGTGLGLSISRHLVEMMHGRLSFESQEEQGSMFAFTASFTCCESQRNETQCVESPAAPPNLPSLRILLVEDNDLNREVARAFLTQAGHKAMEAVNGREALDILARERFDLVLMDVQMPEMDGVSATKALRRSSGWATPRDVPIVAMTAHALKGDRERFLRAGMDEYIPKPIDASQFRETLARAYFRQPTPPVPKASPPERAPSTPSSPLTFMNRDKALELLGGNKQLLARLEQSYIRSIPLEMQAMEEALNARDMETLRRLAHSFKGTSATVGAEEAAHMALQLEQAAKNGDIQLSTQGLEHLRQAAQAALAFLESTTPAVSGSG